MLASDIIKKIRRIEIRTRHLVNQLTGGAYKSVFKGQGMEFVEVREYMQGDDIRTIDWNVTARTNTPFIKKFAEEREMIVFLLVDISASGTFGSTTSNKKELIAELSALIAFSAIGNNDQVGLLLFSDEAELFIPPQKGKSHVLRLIRELLAHEPKNKSTNIRKALERLNHIQKRKAVVFFISDLLDQSNYHDLLKITAKRHDLTMIHITDPLEQRLPNVANIAFEDAETASLTFAPANTKKFVKDFAIKTTEFYNSVKNIAKSSSTDYIQIINGEDYIKPIMTFFKKRERKRH